METAETACKGLFRVDREQQTLHYGTRAKMIWCAERQVSPDAVDAKFSFKLVDGHSEVMMFCAKMRGVRIDYNEQVKASSAGLRLHQAFCQSRKGASTRR